MATPPAHAQPIRPPKHVRQNFYKLTGYWNRVIAPCANYMQFYRGMLSQRDAIYAVSQSVLLIRKPHEHLSMSSVARNIIPLKGCFKLFAEIYPKAGIRAEKFKLNLNFIILVS